MDGSNQYESSTSSALDKSYNNDSVKENEKITQTTADTSSRNEPSIHSALDQLYYINRQNIDEPEVSKEPSKTIDTSSLYDSSTQFIQHPENEKRSKPGVEETVLDPSSSYESSTYSALDKLYYLDRQTEKEPKHSNKKGTSENDWTHYESSTHSTLEQLLAVNLQNTFDENSQTTTTESQPSTNFNLVTEETTIPVTYSQAIEYASQNIQNESSAVDNSISNNFINQNSNLNTSHITNSDTSSSTTTTEKPALILPKRNQRRGRRRYPTSEKSNKDVEFKNLLIEKLIERPYRAKDDYDYLRTVSNVYTTTLKTEDSLQGDEKQPTVLPVTENIPTVSSEANTVNEVFEPTSTPYIATTSSTTTTTVVASTSTTSSSTATPTLTSIVTEAPRTRSSRRRGRHRFTITEASSTPRNSKRRRRPTQEPRATTEVSTTTQTSEHSKHESEESQHQNTISFEAIQRLFDINGEAQDSPIEPASEVVVSTTETRGRTTEKNESQDIYNLLASSTSSTVGTIETSSAINELNLETVGTPNIPITESTDTHFNDKTVPEVTETVPPVHPPVEVYLTSFNPTTEATHITKKKQLKEEPTTPSAEWTSLERFISNIETNTRSVATDKEKIHRALGELNEGETDENGGGVKDVFSVNLFPKIESVEQSSKTVEATTVTVLEETTTEKFKYLYEMIPSILENVADDKKSTYFGELSTKSADTASSTESSKQAVETTTQKLIETLSDTTPESISVYTDSKIIVENDEPTKHDNGHKIILGIIEASAEPDSTTTTTAVENTTLSNYYPETTTPIEVPLSKAVETSTATTYNLDSSTVPPTPRIVVELESTSKHHHDDSRISDQFFDMGNFWENLHTPVDFSPHSPKYADRFGHGNQDQNAGASFPSGKVSHSTESIRQIADEIANLTKSVLDVASLTDTTSSLQNTTPDSSSSQIPTTLDFTTQSPSTTTQEVTTEYSFRRNGRRRGQRPTNARRNPESYQRHRHRFQTESFSSSQKAIKQLKTTSLTWWSKQPQKPPWSQVRDEDPQHVVGTFLRMLH
ncbi:unnamed protein product [Callosobruchus maculatus]|nr:unnamed protein product [Callosobruchus maculatus]